MPIPKKDSALQRKSAKDLVCETLCDRTIRGEMMPGEKLPDTELVAHFSVSWTPVYEALQILETQELIKVIPGRTTTVAGVGKNDIEECYHPLVEIRGLTARLVAPRLTEAQLVRTEEVRMGSGEAYRTDQVEKAIHYDNKFHEATLRAVDNEHITGFSHVFLLHIQRIKYHYFRRDMPRKILVEYRRDILGALYDRDADLAAELVRSRWLYVMGRCLREVEMEGVQ